MTQVECHHTFPVMRLRPTDSACAVVKNLYAYMQGTDDEGKYSVTLVSGEDDHYHFPPDEDMVI